LCIILFCCLICNSFLNSAFENSLGLLPSPYCDYGMLRLLLFFIIFLLINYGPSLDIVICLTKAFKNIYALTQIMFVSISNKWKKILFWRLRIRSIYCIWVQWIKILLGRLWIGSICCIRVVHHICLRVATGYDFSFI